MLKCGFPRCCEDELVPGSPFSGDLGEPARLLGQWTERFCCTDYESPGSMWMGKVPAWERQGPGYLTWTKLNSLQLSEFAAMDGSEVTASRDSMPGPIHSGDR